MMETTFSITQRWINHEISVKKLMSLVGDVITFSEFIEIVSNERKEKEKDFQWVCNECNFPNLTSSVSEEEINSERHSCINCGSFEMHKEYID